METVTHTVLFKILLGRTVIGIGAASPKLEAFNQRDVDSAPVTSSPPESLTMYVWATLVFPSNSLAIFFTCLQTMIHLFILYESILSTALFLYCCEDIVPTASSF